jgi:hypothetical protein
VLAVERVWVLATVSAAAVATAVIAMVPAEPARVAAPEPMRVIPLSGDSVSQLVEDAQTTGGPCLPCVGGECRAIALEEWERWLAIMRAIDDTIYCDANPTSDLYLCHQDS